MLVLIAVLSIIVLVTDSATTDNNYKDQFCTDPRTMRKHAAYSEWPDSYSCTRHRCQPGGRNLAIYTVGCKRVEAPESAIECEEVVEDTNMQFPYCCTRLRCLVVVRGEVWTRVLGQPWETLPAAPWSHMYKMKKPPPGDNNFAPKNTVQGPIYELQSDNENNHDKILRSSKTSSTSSPDCDEPVARAIPAPDIVIALATSNDEKIKKTDNSRQKRIKNPRSGDIFLEEEANKERIDVEIDNDTANEKNLDGSEEKFSKYFGITQKIQSKATWTEIPPSQWNVHDPSMDVDNSRITEDKHAKPSGLQALVDAIGNRMRDIENVVQRMSEKVHNKTPEGEIESTERRSDSEVPKKHLKEDQEHGKEGSQKLKVPSADNDHYKRFSVKNHGSKYLHVTDVTSERPVFVDDTNLNGYFSDASNSVIRRSNLAKEPVAAPTYMAPVDNRRKSHIVMSEEIEKKHKKHIHKKKRKSKGHKKHHNKEDKRKHFNKLSSTELDKNIISLEDSSTI